MVVSAGAQQAGTLESEAMVEAALMAMGVRKKVVVVMHEAEVTVTVVQMLATAPAEVSAVVMRSTEMVHVDQRRAML